LQACADGHHSLHYAGRVRSPAPAAGHYNTHVAEQRALVRVEQLYPFPRAQLVAELKRHASAKEVMWCQEEPQNQGAWYQIQHHLRACLQPGQVLDYAGRARSPSPAAGHMDEHVAEQAQLVADALVNPLDGDHVAE
jgi:2-oxoglutarate dehydrogenase E1 component